jgi:hypothetical protein
MRLKRLLTVVLSAVIFLAAVPSLLAQVTVTAANPSTAAPGTVNLNVTISGSGFKRGAKTQFFLSGTTNPGDVVVNSTTFTSSSQVVATINVSSTATDASYDIQVQNANGSSGKGTELFGVNSTSQNTSQVPLVRAAFRDVSTDRLRSDGVVLPGSCLGYDYADANDPCQPGYHGSSQIMASNDYFLRTLATQDTNPNRWMVLDFSQTLNGSLCPGLDTQLLAYPGRNPAAFSPQNPDPCVDFLEVRLFVTDPFGAGAQFTSVNLIIDGPDLTRTGTNQWDNKYQLNFVNPLSLVPDPVDPNTVTVTTVTGQEQAELWTTNQKTGKQGTLLGRYTMPFQVKLTKLP